MICQKCGKEAEENATVCLGCGCPLVENATPAQPKKSNKKRNIFIILGAILLILAILAVMILPHPNMELDDFSDVGTIGALFQYGIPSRTSDDGEWIYDECIEFYGIRVYGLLYNTEDHSITMFIGGGDENCAAAKHAIEKRCDFIRTYGGYEEYHYDDLIITTDSRGWYITIEFE